MEMAITDISSPTQAQYIERWEQALRMLEAMPPEKRAAEFDMALWGFKTACGTKACFAGHCSLDPWFIAQGFIGTFRPLTRSELEDGYYEKSIGILDFAIEPEEFFGSRGFHTVFLNSGAGYEEIAQGTRELIEWLKDNGDPNYVAEEEEEGY